MNEQINEDFFIFKHHTSSQIAEEMVSKSGHSSIVIDNLNLTKCLNKLLELSWSRGLDPFFFVRVSYFVRK